MPASVIAELEELRGQLRQAKMEVEELNERLQTITASRDQYRTMSLGLEESLGKEKEVRAWSHIYFSFKYLFGAALCNCSSWPAGSSTAQ